MNALVGGIGKTNVAGAIDAHFMSGSARPQHGGREQFSDFLLRMSGKDFRVRPAGSAGRFDG
jgi:hypothetical protein